MSRRFRDLVTRYQAEGLLIDTNLLLLFLVGETDTAAIEKFGRTSSYGLTD